jgi:hypothetical protein
MEYGSVQALSLNTVPVPLPGHSKRLCKPKFCICSKIKKGIFVCSYFFVVNFTTGTNFLPL